jgi:hypothetical protein
MVSACTAVGVVSSFDPLTKLNDAQVLYMSENRPLPAERLIQEALAVYQREDDAHGLGIAYREYGDYSENVRRNSDAKPVTSRAFASLPEELAYRRGQVFDILPRLKARDSYGARA